VYPKILGLDFLSSFGGKKFCHYVGHPMEKSLFTDDYLYRALALPAILTFTTTPSSVSF
jgi:hypothetical protein